MNKIIATLATAAALTLGATPALATGGEAGCRTVTVPAVPAVYETIVTPPVVVTEYEFIQRNRPVDVPGVGAGPHWSADPNWNAQGNLASQGWEASGNTRQTVLEVERTDVVLVAPEIPARDETICITPYVPTPVETTTAPVPAPEESVAPPAAPAAPEAQAPAPVAAVPAAQVEPVAQATPAQPELAYTGYSAAALGWSLFALTLGGVLFAAALRKPRTINK